VPGFDAAEVCQSWDRAGSASARSVQVVAHRGVSRHFPESSVAAFRAAADHGADAVELDVRRTADGVLVVSHDAFVGGVPTSIGRRPYREIEAEVATFDEVASACEPLVAESGMPLGLVIELKCDPGDADHDPAYGLCPVVIEAVHDRGLVDRTLITSFDGTALRIVTELEPSLPTALIELDPRDAEAMVERATARSCRAVLAFGGLLDAAAVDRCHEHGLAVHAWTVDLPEHQRRFLDLGVDGLVTNDPATAREVVRAWSGTTGAGDDQRGGSNCDLATTR
jgi:glycerophosphoryl diester phosphodiesterase